MRGKKTLWLPGTDHAAIATDSKVTKILEKEGLRKKDIGRGKIRELQSQKKRVDEVATGFECGMMVEAKIEIAVGDKVEAVKTVEKI